MNEIKLGSYARDRVTGVEGTVTELMEFDNGTYAVVLQPKSESPSKEPPKPIGCERAGVEIIHTTEAIETPKWASPPYGSRVKNIYNGFTGIVRGRAVFLRGCERVRVYSEQLHEGKPVGECWFDVHELSVINAAEDKPVAPRGGPIPTLTRR